MSYRWGLGSLGAVLGAALLLWWWSTPDPPMSQDAFRVVMATYSAARSEDMRRIEVIAAHLAKQTLSDPEAESIREILDVARAGDWTVAADQAFVLMQQQQR